MISDCDANANIIVTSDFLISAEQSDQGGFGSIARCPRANPTSGKISPYRGRDQEVRPCGGPVLLARHPHPIDNAGL